MEAFFSIIAAKLDPNSLFVLIIFFGVWKIISKFIESFNVHGEKMVSSIEKISDDVHELRKDVGVIVSQVAVHEVRIQTLEKQ